MSSSLPARSRVVVIGAGQAGLSAAWFLGRAGLAPGDGYVVLDHNTAPGGAWQHRWPSLTLSTVNRVHDLPGLALADTVDDMGGRVRAAVAVPRYYAEYESRFDLPVRRPVSVRLVRYADSGGTRPPDRPPDAAHPDGPQAGPTAPPDFVVETDAGEVRGRGIINATGTWERPFRPYYPGRDDFAGEQLHTADYQTAEEFAGRHVVVVGGGISAVQLLVEIAAVTTTTWVTRREPVWSEKEFTPKRGRAAVALVEERVRRGLPPGSVVSVTGLPLTPAMREARRAGILHRHPMFERIVPDGVQWPDGTVQRADVILWCTGFRSALDHLAPLRLRGPGGGIVLDGAIPTRVAAHPRLHLLGYGPSASTIGANRGGRVAVRELLATLGID